MPSPTNPATTGTAVSTKSVPTPQERLKQSTQLKRQEQEEIDRERSSRLSAKARRDKEATKSGSPPESILKKHKRQKAAENSKRSSVVKPHAFGVGSPGLVVSKKIGLESPPGAPTKPDRPVAVTPATQSVLPKVSPDFSEPGSTCPDSAGTDEIEGPTTFISFEPGRRIGVTTPDDDDTVSEFSLFDLEWDIDMATQAKETMVLDHNKVVKRLESANNKIGVLKQEIKDLKGTARQQSENQGRALMESEKQLDELKDVFEKIKVTTTGGRKAANVTVTNLKNLTIDLTKQLAKAKAECETHKKNNALFKKGESALLTEIERLKGLLGSKSPDEGSSDEIKKVAEQLSLMEAEFEKLKRENDLWATKWEQYAGKNGDEALAQALLDIKNAQELLDKSVSSSRKLQQEKTQLEQELQAKSKVAEMAMQVEEANKLLSAENKKLDAENKNLKANKRTRVSDDEDSATSKIQSDNDSLKKQVLALQRQLRVASRGSRTQPSEPVTRIEALTPDERDRETLIRENLSLKNSNARLQMQLEKCSQALKDNGKFLKAEVSKTAAAKINSYIKTVSFHSFKFVTTDVKFKVLMKSVYNGIKGDPELRWDDENEETHLSLSEFQRIYAQTCREKVNGCRQYTQTKCLEAAIEFYKEFGRLLTLEDLEKMRDPIPEDEDSTEYGEKTKLLTWYFDSWLPACAGIQHYGVSRRCYHRATKAVVDGNPNHPKVAYVPLHSEALGLVILENCKPKWEHVVPKKAADPSWAVPSYSKANKETWKYNKTLWSDGKSGKVVNGGWKPEAINAFNGHLDSLKKFRDQDKANNHNFYNFGLQLVKHKNGVTDNDPPVSSKKSRKRKAQSLEERVQVLEIEEVDDDFSVHSEEE